MTADAHGRGPRQRLRLLDLYSCEGGAARGYDHAGFDVYGVDLFTALKGGFSRSRYPYASWQGDALEALRRLLEGEGLPFTKLGRSRRSLEVAPLVLRLQDFAGVHASPPCQHASAGTRAMRSRGDTRHPALIEPTRELLQQTDLPYVIENVKGAALHDPVVLCGTMFQLRAVDEDGTPLEMWRHRLFESNINLQAPGECAHGAYSSQVAGSYGGARRDKDEARHIRHGGYVPSRAVQQRLLGVDWMTERGMYQCLPPVYTEWTGIQMMQWLEAKAAA